MTSCNLILHWLRSTTRKDRRALLRRIRRRISVITSTPGVEPNDPIDALAMSLFFECADHFKVTPTELHSLLENPREQCLHAIVAMCLSQIVDANADQDDSEQSGRAMSVAIDAA